MTRRIGFEGKLYWGTAGSTASTELTIARDVSYSIQPTTADVSDRSSIIDHSRVAGVTVGLEFEVNNDNDNAFIAAVRAAAIAGTTIAFRTRDRTNGVGLDGDFNVGLDESQALRDAQRIGVTCTPNNDIRSVQWN